ncbi:hypothetical protein K1F50_15840 [Muricauda oceani]|uniref:RNA polymerase alpha subunit C-terminal domain-containing protein n=1 Tax=Flagellimonas oceani TaxID=2698672 RepID=A0A6G7J0U6_9FLAO|nr:hypothetical protein [Allomuricauda oceani]MBW8244281.1 hypothetical protein [Allomuricauda oceani]QII44072.1 hypothetical protein GVT53_05095 [Allomuricauda oceani]
MKNGPKIDKDSFIRDCHLSVRTQNVLYNNSKAFGVRPIFPITNNDLKVSDIGKLSLRAIGDFRNCGKKTLLEIIALCTKAGVKFKQEKNSSPPTTDPGK